MSLRHFYTLISFSLLSLFTGLNSLAQTQPVQDDFEGNGNINSWTADDCIMQTNFQNPFSNAANPSAKVLRYRDIGGQYANIRFDVSTPFNLTQYQTFRLKIYVPSSGISGNQPNQFSLKLQNGSLPSPWITQCEIIKPIQLNQWQELSFNFLLDSWQNFDPASGPPTSRTDFSRVVIQVNGENNNNLVLAYIDDILNDDSQPVDPVYDQLVWSDEFDGNGAIDNGHWFHQTQLPAGGSWFNGELQHYTNRLSNSYLSNGSLKITARRENYSAQGQTKNYTSARLNSKFAFTYGRVEFRAKLPSGAGTWPALWTLGKNISESGAYWQTQGYGNTSWPACGEIDIMEHWGNNPNFVQSATHTPSSFGDTQNKGGRMLSSAFSDFHVYSLDWFPDRLVFKVDEVVHYIYNPTVKNAETWPFNSDQYLLLNLAIQGEVPANFTQAELEVDYVRIYQGGPTAAKPMTGNSPIRVYPNPVSNYLKLTLPELPDEVLKVELLGTDGRIVRVFHQQLQGSLLEISGLSGLPPGLYSGIVSSETKRRVFRFEKE